jgi:alcohol dehydrogenase YqhD (iron-dependent ADH family)
MKDFEWYCPTTVIFGNGVTEKIGEAAKPYGTKTLLVYGAASIKKTGLYDRIFSHLNNAGISIVDFGGAKSNPVLSHVRKGIQLARSEKVDFVTAVGGGSVIDTAKAIAIGVLNDQDIWDFFTYKAFAQKALPVVVLVTIPASGSEMNTNCVITNEETKEKFGCTAEVLYPKVSIMDPSVTFSVSKSYTAYSAADIFSHVLDAYFTSTAEWTPMQDGIAEAILRALMQSVDRIMKNPEDYDARATMMWCAPWALNRLISSGLGPTFIPLHILEHPISAVFDIAHGAGMSIIIPSWLTVTAKSQLLRCAQLARNVFGVVEADDAKAAEKGTTAMKRWFDSIGAPTSFSAANISTEQVDKLIDQAYNHWKNLGLDMPKDFFAGVYNLAR